MSDDAYAARIFLRSALPLLPLVVEARPGLARGFAGSRAVFQVSARLSADPGLREAELRILGDCCRGADPAAPRAGTHFLVGGGPGSEAPASGGAGTALRAAGTAPAAEAAAEPPLLKTVPGLHPAPELELEFGDLAALDAFFRGRPKGLPKIRGALRGPGLFLSVLRSLLAMGALLGAKEPPAEPGEAALVTRLYLSLLSSGISGLNKAGHPEAAAWARKSPDRVYAWEVEGRPELGAYVRVKAGNSRSARGPWLRSRPFFAMRFDSPASALGVLLEKDDMIAATAEGRLSMLGAPEYGAALGELMKLVGRYAK